MKTGLYSIYDKKAKYYSKPFQAQNDEVAIRTIANTFRDPQAAQSEYVQNPEDFTLAKIATFDDSNAIVESDLEALIDFTAFKEDNENEK